MKKTRIIIFLLICLVIFQVFDTNNTKASADELSENIIQQLENIDLSKLDDYYNSLDLPDNYRSVVDLINNIVRGEYNNEFDSIGEYLIDVLFNGIKRMMPLFVALVSIFIIFGILKNARPNIASDGVLNLILFISIIGVITLLSNIIIEQYIETKNTIENIANLTQIMSPIIITLMMASGGTVSAAVYTPAVSFLSTGIINIVNNVLLPLIGIVAIITIISNLSTSIKLDKFTDLFSGIIKWTLGIIVTIFTFFLSAQGITSATYDGISTKAAKYAISNSIPIVGGFIRDGFDLVVAGSVLIKNAVGVGVIYTLFFTVLFPIINMLSISLILKFLSSVAETVSDQKLSNVLTAASKCISYMIAMLFVVALMLFITVLLMVFSANSFI